MNKHIITGFIALTVLLSCSQNFKAHREQVSGSGYEELSKNDKTKKGSISSESIFQLPDSFQTQDSKPLTLAMLKGKPTVIGMIFTHCTYACSRLTADIKNVADSLQADASNVNFVLISFDTERDKPARLKSFADEMGLDNNWTLLHGNDEAVRTLSVLLNVQYEKDAGGNFSHSNLVSILDKNGVLKYQQEGLNADHTETVSTLQQLIRQG